MIIKLRNILSILVASAMVCACAIPDDIPYPIVEGIISAFEVEGQCAAPNTGKTSADIDKANNTVSLYVSDTVDLAKLRITRFEVSNNATIIPDSNAVLYHGQFPSAGFVNSQSNNTRVNFTNPVNFTLRTYQDYTWTVNVQQIMEREVEVDNQVGRAVIDPVNRNVIIYVNKSQSLRRLHVTKFTLGGEHGKVSPDPTEYDTYDFYEPQTFYVTNGWSEISQKWTVFVYQTEAEVVTTAEVFARTVSATVSGNKPNGRIPTVQYKQASGNKWIDVPGTNVSTSSTSYTAEILGLKANTKYVCRTVVDDKYTDELTFQTTSAQQLENASLDEWHQNGKLYNPWSNYGQSYWDTGNAGAATVGQSNTTPTDDTSTGTGFAANLQSKFIVIKFAAGNIFTGTYIKTDGTNGILGFGRPFTSFPTKMTFDYKYHTSTINRCADDDYAYLKGRPDSCQIYIALADWDEVEYEGVKYPYLIRTRPTERHLFDPNDSHIIAYAQLTKGEDVRDWTKAELTLDYKVKNRQPKWILVVASASKYGDFFTGGDESLLKVDNFNLVYE